MYGTKPGLYLLAPQSWDGAVPAAITGVFRFDTRIAICIPRVFMDDTDADRAATQDVIAARGDGRDPGPARRGSLV